MRKNPPPKKKCLQREKAFLDTNSNKAKFTKKSFMNAFTNNSGQVQYSRKMSYKLRTVSF